LDWKNTLFGVSVDLIVRFANNNKWICSMNTLLEDFHSPLCQVDRAWMRRPVLFFVFIILFIPCAIFGLLNGILDLTGEVRKCW
jgi:hypothetical protein